MVGIYDSGLGGLTAFKEARALMHDTDIVYFGDTANLPYGTKSEAAIIRYARNALNFFRSFGAEAVLCACGTVSSVALPVLQDEFDFPVFGVVEPTVSAAVLQSKNKKIGVCGTAATVKSNIFSRKIRALCQTAEVKSVACDLFVAIAENGFANDGEISVAAARRYLSHLADCDTLILGCTHFPLLSEAIRAALPSVLLVNSGREGAKSLTPYAKREGGEEKFYLSDTGGSFAAMAKIFLGYEITPIKM